MTVDALLLAVDVCSVDGKIGCGRQAEKLLGKLLFILGYN